MKRKPSRTTTAFSKVKAALEDAIAYHHGQGRLTARDRALKGSSPASAKTRPLATSARRGLQRRPARWK
jgi:hypothetical protein